jgi:hypothetical protein
VKTQEKEVEAIAPGSVVAKTLPKKRVVKAVIIPKAKPVEKPEDVQKRIDKLEERKEEKPLLQFPAPDPFAEGNRKVEQVDKPKDERKNQPLLVTKQEEDIYRKFLPRGDTGILRSLPFRNLTWYNDRVIPKLYQIFDKGNGGVTRVNGGQQTANNEFPWAEPGGIASTGSNHKALRFVDLKGMEIFPLEKNGRFSGYGWRYLPDTMFGELILVTDEQGADHTAILRLRIKRENGTWRIAQYQPFPTKTKLAEAVKGFGFNFPQEPAQFFQISSGHIRNAFSSQGMIEAIPRMDGELVSSLLDEKFEPLLDQVYDTVDGINVVSPTARGFSLVPSGWLGGFIPVNGESCMNCHKDAGHVVNLDDETRWRLRGSDAIFSFHPFAPDAGTNNQLAQFNPILARAGLIFRR